MMRYFLIVLQAGMLCFSLAAAYAFLFAARRENPALTALPRNRSIGTILGGWIIFACVPHVVQLLEGSVLAAPVMINGENYYILQYIVAAFLIWFVWKFSDYHFARGVAAALIFMAYLMLREGFALNLPGYPVFATLYFLTGSLGIVIGAKPVWLRDWLIAAQGKKAVRLVSGTVFMVAAVMFAVALAVTIFA